MSQPQSLPSNNSRCNNNPTRSKPEPNPSSAAARECAKCRYAVYPNSRRCSNPECAQHVRKNGGALTAAELLHEYAPPALFHGRHWGEWTLDTERFCLVYKAQPVLRGEGSRQYTGFFGHYEIDIERIRRSSGMLDWIFQINGKSWANARVTKDLVNAFDDVFHPQANLCSGACGGGTSNKIIENPTAFLKHRIATVGNNPVGEAA
jgi:hypothetical protein